MKHSYRVVLETKKDREELRRWEGLTLRSAENKMTKYTPDLLEGQQLVIEKEETNELD